MGLGWRWQAQRPRLPIQLFILGRLLKRDRPTQFAKTDKAVPPSAHRTHEVQAEAIDVGLGFVGLEHSSATDARPHDPSLLPSLKAAQAGWEPGAPIVRTYPDWAWLALVGSTPPRCGRYDGAADLPAA